MKTVSVTKSVNGAAPSPRVPRHVLDLLERQKDAVIKIDLGGGEHSQPGFINMDIRDVPGVDIVHDWDDMPWPLPSACATLIMAGHVVEHVDPARRHFLKWMDECWRILKYDGQMMITAPYAGSAGDFSDPTHCNHVTHRTWEWFDPLATYGGQLTRLYYQYKPKPWRIQNNFYQLNGNLETLLVKRREDPSYK